MIPTAPAMTAALLAVVLGSIVAVCWPRPMGSIVSLAAASVALAVAIFLAGYPIAAVFEATVAAGLISILFLFVVELTDDPRHWPRGRRAAIAIAGAVGFGGAIAALSTDVAVTAAPATAAASFWTQHPLDVVLVAVLVLVGVLGVVRLAGPGGETA